MGNVTQLPPVEGQGANFQQEFKDFYATSKAAPLFGFVINNSNIVNEFAALGSVAGQYALQLSVGAVDPATELPKLIATLETNGIQKFLDDVNAQYEAFKIE
jgi:putative aldouronate transport system substrate-binding protein